MIIDWYTVLFQLINFLSLVVLLRIFLYRPILKAMDERAELVVKKQEEAAARLAEAEAEASAYRLKREELQAREKELLEQARAAAEAERKKLTGAARLEIEEIRRRWEEAFYRQRETFIRELRRELGRQACLIARRTLQDLARADLEEMVWQVFMEKLQELRPEDAEKLGTALSGSGGERPLVARGAFPVPEEKLERLRQALAERFSAEPRLVFEHNPDLICGLELDADGYRVGWNVDDYLDGVEKRILSELEEGLRRNREGEQATGAKGREAAPDGASPGA